MPLALTGINLLNQYNTNWLQTQLTSQQLKIQNQQSEIHGQQLELQKYQTKMQEQQQQIQEQDSTIQIQNQKLQHENVKNTTNIPSKQEAPALLTQQNSKPLTYDIKSIRANYDQRVQHTIEVYQANQISTQIPTWTPMTMPLNLFV
jgi:hypothetical protein